MPVQLLEICYYIGLKVAGFAVYQPYVYKIGTVPIPERRSWDAALTWTQGFVRGNITARESAFLSSRNTFRTTPYSQTGAPANYME